MKALTILSDMDSIVTDCFRYWLDKINADHGVGVEPGHITRWDMHKCPPLDKLGAGPVYAYLQQPGFFRNMPALPGALETLKTFHDAGHLVLLLSSPSGPISASEKLDWVTEHLPWMKLDQVMLVNSKRKVLVNGDVLIDDHPDTLVEYKKFHPGAFVAGIEYPYNRHVNIIRGPYIFPDYRNTAFAWEKILGSVNHLADDDGTS